MTTILFSLPVPLETYQGVGNFMYTRLEVGDVRNC